MPSFLFALKGWNWTIPGKLGQYHGCCWPGSMRCQAACSHVRWWRYDGLGWFHIPLKFQYRCNSTKRNNVFMSKNNLPYQELILIQDCRVSTMSATRSPVFLHADPIISCNLFCNASLITSKLRHVYVDYCFSTQYMPTEKAITWSLVINSAVNMRNIHTTLFNIT